MPILIQVIWENIWNHTVGKSQINATNETWALFAQTKMQSMRLCLFWLKIFEKSFEITQWRKVKKWNQCDFACSDPIYLSKHLKSHSGEKSNKCNECDSYSIPVNNLRTHLKIDSGEKKKIQSMRLCQFWSKLYEKTFEITQWGKVK